MWRISVFIVEHLSVKHDDQCDAFISTEYCLYNSTIEALLSDIHYGSSNNDYQQGLKLDVYKISMLIIFISPVVCAYDHFWRRFICYVYYGAFNKLMVQYCHSSGVVHSL